LELALLVLVCLLTAAALFAGWRLHRRLGEIEERIQDSSALAFLPDRVQAVARAIESADLGGLHERVERLAEGVARVEDLVITPGENGGPAGTREQQVRARVIRHLRDEGYSSIRLQTDAAELGMDPAVVRIQALKRGALIHGTVTVTGDEIGEVHLDPLYTAFP